MARLNRAPGPAGLEWLESKGSWAGKLGPEWVGLGILGRANKKESIIGLFDLRSNITVKDPLKRLVRRVVVKQSPSRVTRDSLEANIVAGFFNDRLKREEDIHTLLNSTNSDYVLKMYRPMLRDFGRLDGRLVEADGVLDVVDRLFLEYCPGGTMKDFLTTLKTNPQYMLEEQDVWHIFRSLAKACAVCSRGSEDPNQTPWQSKITHFDLSPRNIFIGGFKNINDRMPIFKFGNFSKAFDIDGELGNEASEKNKAQYYGFGGGPPNTNNTRIMIHRGCETAAPELNFTQTLNRHREWGFRSYQITDKCNIWGVGTLMYLLLTRQDEWLYEPPEISPGDVEDEDFLYDDLEEAQVARNKGKTVRPLGGPCDWSPRLQRAGNYLHGMELFGDDLTIRSYSKELRTLILECLLREQTERPSYAELEARTEAGFRNAPVPRNNKPKHPTIRALREELQERVRASVPCSLFTGRMEDTVPHPNWAVDDAASPLTLYIDYYCLLYRGRPQPEAMSGAIQFIIRRLHTSTTIEKLKRLLFFHWRAYTQIKSLQPQVYPNEPTYEYVVDVPYNAERDYRLDDVHVRFGKTEWPNHYTLDDVGLKNNDTISIGYFPAFQHINDYVEGVPYDRPDYEGRWAKMFDDKEEEAEKAWLRNHKPNDSGFDDYDDFDIIFDEVPDPMDMDMDIDVS